MKTGAAHSVPLSPRAVDLLENLPREDGNDFVFIGTQPGSRLASRVLIILMREVDQKSTVHGLRSTFRDWCAERTNVDPSIAEMALAHQVGNAAARAYNRSDLLEKRRALMEAWCRFCSNSEQDDNKVVPLFAG